MWSCLSFFSVSKEAQLCTVRLTTLPSAHSVHCIKMSINTEAFFLIRCQSYFCALWTLRKRSSTFPRRGSVVAAMSTDQGTLWMFILIYLHWQAWSLQEKGKAWTVSYRLTRIQAIFIHLPKTQIPHSHPSHSYSQFPLCELTQSRMRPRRRVPLVDPPSHRALLS